MKRYVLLCGALIFAVISAAFLMSLLKKPNQTEYRLARGRAQVETENYLAALQTLRDVADFRKGGIDAHSYLGAAYLKLHLYRAAIQEFEAASQAQPKESDPWIGLASSYIELGDGPKAVDNAKRATEIEKRSVDAWLALGRAQWQQQNLDLAEKAALKARELDAQSPAVSDLLLHVYFDQNQPDRFQAELDRNSNPSKPAQDLAVRSFLARGQFGRAFDFMIRHEREALDRAILESQLALQRDASKTSIIPQLVKNLIKVGRYEEAINTAKTYNGPVALDLELGKACWMTGRKDEAIQAYERASKALIHKLSAEVALAGITGDIRHWEEAYRAERVEQDYFVLARLEEVMPKAGPLELAFIFRYAAIYEPAFYNKAAEEALKVLNDDPKNFDALMTISTAYQRIGRLPEAARYLQLARDNYPKSGEPPSRLANLLLFAPQKDPQQVVQYMETAVRLDPGNAGYLYNLGWTYDQLGETARATELYQRAIKASPLSFEAMNNLALIYTRAGQPDRALPLLEQAMKTDPENEAVYANAANYWSLRRDWKQALENYDAALQINPASTVAAVEKGRIQLEQGKTDDAVDSLSHALEVDPHSFDAYLLLSSAYEKMGHVKEAIAAVDEAQRIRADAPEAKAMLDRLNARKDSK